MEAGDFLWLMESEVAESTEYKLRWQWVEAGVLEEVHVVSKTWAGGGYLCLEKASLARERNCLVRRLWLPVGQKPGGQKPGGQERAAALIGTRRHWCPSSWPPVKSLDVPLSGPTSSPRLWGPSLYPSHMPRVLLFL